MSRSLVATLLTAALALSSGSVASARVAAGEPYADALEQLGETSRAEAAALTQLLSTQAQRRELERGLAELQTQVAAVAAQVAAVDAELESIRGRIQVTRQELRAARRQLNASAGGAYIKSQAGEAYEWILATQPDEVSAGARYLTAISTTRSALVDQIEVLELELEQAEDEAGLRRETVEGERSRLDALRATQQAAVDSVRQQQIFEESLLAAFARQREEFEREVGLRQASSDSISTMLAARGATAGVGNAPCDARPVPGGISSGFGPRIHPVYGTVRQHNGLDMAGSAGDPITACRAGTVVIAGAQGGYGNAVVIDHGGGMATLYAHQSRLAVQVGQQVDAGAVIGFVGSTGVSTGPHLHFEVRVLGTPIDAGAYL